MSDRLDRMSSLLNGEQTAQSKRLDDILAARRKKKEDLQKKFVQVNQTVEAQQKEFSNRLVKLAGQAQQDERQIEEELAEERQRELAKIQEEQIKRRNERVAGMEERIKKLRDSGKATDKN